MDTTRDMVALAIVAVTVGILGTLVVQWARSTNSKALTRSRIPAGAIAAIQALDVAAIFVGDGFRVMYGDARCMALGLAGTYVVIDPELRDLIDEVRATGRAASRDIEVRVDEGTDRGLPLRIFVTPFEAGFLLVTVNDLSEAQRLEQMRRDFVANVSHELKTPIGAISLMSEAIENLAEKDAKVVKFAKKIGEESQRLARLTNDIIRLSVVQSLDADALSEATKVRDMVQSAVDAAQGLADARDVTVKVKKFRGVKVLGNKELLNIAISNLVSNAINYSHEGGQVGIGVDVRDATVEINVSDNGVGIPEDELARVFERFYRTDPARQRNTGGTGLGLAIVKHIVQGHGGDVRVWSQVGKGTTFTVILPRHIDGEIELDPDFEDEE
ncbi:two-component system sensor histidine kinase SenX3 [Microbacteriaceae bacterium MWH-Ta3]|nr:two-component system sensor histidine kinase SenX3 [Microbacteriaceae bacterium MWH-Ta3]